MVQLTYYEPTGQAADSLPPEPRWVPAPDDAHTLRHGYNLADIERLARIAVRAARAQAMDYQDRYEAAWYAIVEGIYTAIDAPDPWELKRLGADAVNRLQQDYGHTWGYDRRNPDAGFEGMRGFRKYWELDRRAHRSCEDGVVDRVALWQIWERLSATHQAMLLALAAYEDPVAASAAVGKRYNTFNTHLKNARREFLTLWHEGETPSRFWGKGDRRRGRRSGVQLLVNRRQQRERRALAEVEPKPAKPPRTHCSNGHRLVPDILTAAGRCKACGRDRSALYRAKKRGAAA
ncbi:hypothetical protein E1287_07215 [Actinomadura sp. KC06]|uniref:hypothetical protein n=1 Tax=Actinomadura sp. KC06 TaxID=2530369 RepID=UPI00104C3CDC|nr:hypothetical protein [Actinomadura sp. KC06]TDD37841.1 hypothetical protein E1287_07215 [Actinomadura sp. KC06]